MIFWDTMVTPLGELLLASTDSGLSGLYFDTHRYGRRPGRDWARAAGGTHAARVLAIAREELVAYFAGSLDRFTVPLAARGSEFQNRVWIEPSPETLAPSLFPVTESSEATALSRASVVDWTGSGGCSATKERSPALGLQLSL